jgi:UDP-glucose 4-epimerase
VERVTGRTVPARVGPRRPGDPPRLVASAERAAWQLGFRPIHSKLDDIVATAFRWREAHPGGYGSAS